MFWALLKKQLLLFIRRPQEVLILLAMPIVLIFILGFSLGPVFNKEQSTFHVTVGLVEHTTLQDEVTNFQKEVTANISTEQSNMFGDIEELLPTRILKEEVFGSEDVKSFITLESIQPSDLDTAKNDKKYAAIIEVPPHFSSDLLSSLYFDKDAQPELKVYLNEDKGLSANVVNKMLHTFQEQYSTMALLGKEQLLSKQVPMAKEQVTTKIHVSENEKNMGALSYYSIGMTVMFVLYVASSVGHLSFLEKYHRLFDRIVLSNVSPLRFLSSIAVSAMIIAFLQLSILFLFSYLFYDVSYPDWTSVLLVSLLLSTAVGGFGAVLSSLNYLFDNQNTTNLFQSAIVSLLAFLGGSFFNVRMINDFLGTLGDFTPNGAAMSAYLKIMQGDGFGEIVPHLLTLSCYTVILLSIAVVLFPKKGGVA